VYATCSRTDALYPEVGSICRRPTKIWMMDCDMSQLSQIIATLPDLKYRRYVVRLGPELERVTLHSLLVD